jgi:carbon-monoxide dehydrogenase medium subunit
VQAFEYSAPRTLDEAVRFLRRNGAGEPRVLAGGTDLIVQLREGRRQAALVVDIKHIPELMELRHDDRTTTIGAAVPCARIYGDAEMRRRFPALIESASLIGGIQIQSRASLGGNLCNASPAADSVPTLIALGAACGVDGPEGERVVLAEHFCSGPGENALRPGELLVRIVLPAPQPHAGAAFERFIPRNEMDIAVANAAAHVVLSDDGTRFASARVAVGACAPTPLLVREAGEALAGQAVGDEAIGRAAEAVRAAVRPITDMRGSAAQRRHLAGVLVRRVIERAVERARAAQ